MKASEIIRDDILSKEKRLVKDYVGAKTKSTSQDYFGNRSTKRPDRDLQPKIKKEETSEGPLGVIDEESMAAAAHNPSGPRFGGYYGATQKGPPKPGQGFGGAAESVGQELDEVAPPGMEDTVMALKKKFPGNPGRAFATAWSIYNKQKGKK